MTNEANARQLFVSARTVERHMGNIYTSWACTGSRAHLAGAIPDEMGHNSCQRLNPPQIPAAQSTIAGTWDRKERA